MAHRNQDELPDDFQEVDAQLRAHRYETSAVELDDLKRRTMNQSARRLRSRQGKGTPMRSKILTLLLVAGFAVTGGGAAVLAAKGGDGNAQKNAANKEYKPGKGCGDKNHTHTGPPGNPGNTDCPPQAGKKK